jgi:hypothetical protein
MSRDSAVGMATGYGLNSRGNGVRVPVGAKFFSSRSVSGQSQPPIQWVQGDLPPGVKRPGHEADHSPPANAELKNTWMYTVTPPYIFMA